MDVRLSWDGGSSWTDWKRTTTEPTSEATTLLGGPTDLWGHGWSADDLSNANFRVEIRCVSESDERDFYLDWVPVRVHYSTDLEPNPDLPAGCGLDVIFVLDESGSIVGIGQDAEDISDQVRAAASTFLNALVDTGSRVTVVEFNSAARNPIPFTTVTPETIATIFDPYLIAGVDGSPDDDYYDPEDYGSSDYWTNWEDALEEVQAINTASGVAPLVVFFTDGNPTTYNGHTPPPEAPGAALAAAVPVADAVKA
jgi:hypothetical protein